MYQATKSIVKDATRQIVMDVVYKHRTQLKHVVTLPNTNFTVESNILKKTPTCKIVSFEYDKKTYRRALHKKPSRVKLLHEDIFTHDFGDTKQDFVWLDLCNTFTETTINKVVEFVHRLKFGRNSTFAVTLTYARGKKSENIKYDEYYHNYKEHGAAFHIGGFINAKISETKTLRYANYDVVNKASQMIVFIFKLNANGTY